MPVAVARDAEPPPARRTLPAHTSRLESTHTSIERGRTVTSRVSSRGLAFLSPRRPAESKESSNVR